ncbi:MAG: hypothetical protein DRN12_02735 [Thermoplasmata archaeon]|nr:MAG: hypothetical protein DRN12_02735 [Thermoplasmata archaeon]
MIILTRKLFIVSMIFLLFIPIIPLSSHNPVQAEPSSETKLYFRKVDLNMSGENYDSSGMILLMSETPPTSVEDSYYPPPLFKGLNVNTEEVTAWLALWAFSSLNDLTDLPPEFKEFLDSYEILIPNPLRIVEGYENIGDKSLNINGSFDFDLYFHISLASKRHPDKASIGIYTFNPNSIMPIPKELRNVTLNLTGSQNIINKRLNIKDISYKLQPGELLLFKVELIPSDKPFVSSMLKDHPTLKKLVNKTLASLKKVAENRNLSKIQSIFDLIEIVKTASKELNFTSEDLKNVTKAMISSSFVYNSVSHPSSVTVPFTVSTKVEENKYTYYLHGNSSMDKSKPTSSQSKTVDLLKEKGEWKNNALSRNKILTEASALLYLKYKDLSLKPNMNIEVTLLSDDKIIASADKQLSKTWKSSIQPYEFIFPLGNGVEVTHDAALQFKITLKNASTGVFRELELYYDSKDHPSYISLTFEETKHITVNGSSNPSDGKIIPGDKVIYIINVNSDLPDTIDVYIKNETFSSNEKNNWNIIINPSSFTINGSKEVTVKLVSKDNSFQAYGEKLNVTIIFEGKTGITSFDVHAEISEDAVTYSIIIIPPEGREVIHGTNYTYSFIVINNNTGYWPDNYNIIAESSHEWRVEIEPNSIQNLSPNINKTVNVTIFVPDNTDVKIDQLNFTVLSRKSGVTASVSINTTIIGANILEGVYDFFQSIATDIGFNEVFGSYGAHALGAIILIIIFFILIIIALIVTTKYVEIICVDRIREIDPDEKAEYPITIRNPTKKPRSYKFNVNVSSPDKWKVTLTSNKAMLSPGQSKKIILKVEPTDKVEQEDWTEIVFIVETLGIRKTSKINLLTTLRKGYIDISVEDVSHWPRRFIIGEKVSTTFKLSNKGNMPSSPVSISFKINGEEKHKLDDIVIPPKSYARVTIPWIAEKSKNDISIQVSQH